MRDEQCNLGKQREQEWANGTWRTIRGGKDNTITQVISYNLMLYAPTCTARSHSVTDPIQTL